MPIGTTELIIILVIVLVLFGASRVPELGRSLGSGMRNFKDAVTGRGDDEDGEAPDRAELGPGAAAPEAAERGDAQQPAAGVPAEPGSPTAAPPGEPRR